MVTTSSLQTVLLQSPPLVNTLPLFGYRLDARLLAEGSDFTTQVFVAAVDDRTEEPVVLVYDASRNSLSSLQRAIPHSGSFLEVSGQKVNFVLGFNEKKEPAITQVYEYPQFVVRPANSSSTASANIIFKS